MESEPKLFEANPPFKRRWPKAGGLMEENSNNQKQKKPEPATAK
jgi:hypothetical protein